jgi:hypothetical protein
MRPSPVWITGILLTASCFCAHGQTTETPAAPTPVPQSAEAKAAEEKGLPPRVNAAEYQAQGQAGAITIGAEFAGHSVPKPEGPLSTEDFVVVEAGVFGAPGAKMMFSTEDFSLRINGKKSLLPSQPYGFVTRSLKDPVWYAAQEVAAKEAKDKAGSGNGISTGGAAKDDASMPVFIHVPIEMQRSMADYVRKSSLPIGERPLPIAGLLFFRYAGRAQSIHSIELIYSGPAGKATLALQP